MQLLLEKEVDRIELLFGFYQIQSHKKLHLNVME